MPSGVLIESDMADANTAMMYAIWNHQTELLNELIRAKVVDLEFKVRSKNFASMLTPHKICLIMYASLIYP